MLPVIIWSFVLFVFIIVLYNGIIKAKNDVENNKSTIQTVLQNRYDLIPNLVQVVQQYTSHEKSIIENVSTMRAQMVSAGNTKLSSEEQNSLWWAMKSIFALSENYPDLKANTNFINLQNQWSELEDRLQAARRWYNYAVTTLKNKKETFPSNLIASLVKTEEYELFEGQEIAQNAPSAKDLFANK
jgi:LemA protein